MRRIIFKRGYHKIIIDHFENPRNIGSFAKNEKKYWDWIGGGRQLVVM